MVACFKGVLVASLLAPCVVGLSSLKSSSAQGVKFAPKATLLQDIEEDASGEMKLVEFSAFPGVKLMTGDSIDKWSVSFRRAKSWETEDVQTFCAKFREHGKRGNLLDVGGHMGSFTLPFADCIGPDHTVITVEAMPYQRKHLRQAIKANNFQNVHLYEYAIGPVNETGSTMMFKEMHFNPARAVYAPNKGTIAVTSTTLDEIMQQEPAMKSLFAMKIDIEGCEKMAMEGASELLKTPPCMMLMEVNEMNDQKKTEMLELLGKAGYARAEDLKAGGWVGLRNYWFVQKDFDACVARL